MTDYLISAETRDQLIDLLEEVARGGNPTGPDPTVHAGLAADADGILTHIKGALPVDDVRAKVLEAIHTDPIVHAAYVMGQDAVAEGFRDALPVAERAKIARAERAAAEEAFATDADIARANFAGLPRDVEVDSLGIPIVPDDLRRG